MISFTTPLIVVSGLTFGGELLSPQLARQRDEFLPLLNFEAFVYALFVVTGFSILAKNRPRVGEWFASFFIVPFSGALSGWVLGLTLSVLAQGK